MISIDFEFSKISNELRSLNSPGCVPKLKTWADVGKVQSPAAIVRNKRLGRSEGSERRAATYRSSLSLYHHDET
jgi:hypothetical protein